MPTTATMPEPPAAPPPGSEDRGLHPGARLGDYRLLAPIGSGGMANVWAAARSGDYGFERLFAIKVMRDEIAQDAEFRRMFLDEAKVAARIHHTHVVDVIDLGEDGGTVYQVMPLVEGDSLARLLRASDAVTASEPVPRSVAVRIVVDTLRGLHAAHETRDGRDGTGAPMGVVHRDVSPQNILVGIDGVAKIADFGVAKVMGRIAGRPDTGAPKGKVAYMAPEQLGRGEIDRRCDVFAAGIVLWELLVGRRLEPAAASVILSGLPLDAPSTVDPRVPAPLSDATMRALAARPDDRYASADAMADALEMAARDCGLALSSKEVASWATARATRTLARRKEQVAEAVGTIGAAATVSELAPPRARRGRRAGLAIASVAVVGAIVATVAFTRRAPSAGAGTEPTAIASPAAPPAPLVPAATSSSSPASSIAPSRADVPAPPVVASPSPAARPDAGAPSRAKGRGHATPAPRPKFANPYAP